MLVIIMLEQRVVGVVGLDAAGSRIRMPSAKAPGACLGHEPGDTKGQQRSQADSRNLAMTSANALEQQRSRRHAVYGMQGVRGSNPLSSTTTAAWGCPREVCREDPPIWRSYHSWEVRPESILSLAILGSFVDVRRN